MSAPGTAREVLVAAREFLADERHWARGAYAIGKSGRAIKDVQKAEKCCAIGAIARVAGVKPVDVEKGVNAGNAAMWRLTKLVGQPGNFLPACVHVTKFNDSATHPALIAAFDRAIAACDDH